MLKITTNENPQVVTLQLEGRLFGPWVAVLHETWTKALPAADGRRLRVDLDGVTFVDPAGKAELEAMCAQGAEMLAQGLETKAIIAEIRKGPAAEGDGEAREPRRNKSNVNVSEHLENLQRLQAELHAVNEYLAKAARPLDRIADLNEQQRQEVATQLRAGLVRWESVTKRIAQELGLDRTQEQVTRNSNEGGSR